MKLYTEEQLRKALQIGMNIGYSNNFDLNKLVEETDKGMTYLTPIELPSNEEIEKEGDNLYYGTNFKQVFTTSAKYVIDKIKNQIK